MTHRTGRHRAPSAHSRTLSTLAAAGAALSASLLTPAAAMAAPSHAEGAGRDTADHDRHDTEAGGTYHRASPHTATRHTRPRPMTSGERQYRNGCLQGYITEDCQEFSVTELLRHGINPFE